MTSTPVTSLLKRTGNASDRPSGNIIVNGELAMSFGAADPGVYFEDSAGSIRKIGPTAYGTVAPNAVPVGLAGNSLGELWTDSNTTTYYLKVWNGTAWQKVGAAFADVAGSANVTIASGSRGALLASGSLGSVVASGALGAVLASGVVTATGVSCSDIYTGSLTGTGPSGSLRYKIDNTGTPSGLYVAFAGGWALV